MISVDIYGGLGNQMFQYALGRSIAIHRNEELQIEARSFDNYELREFLLDQFNIRAHIKDLDEKHCKISNRYINFAIKNLLKLGVNVYPLAYFEKNNFTYDEQVFNTSAKYFEGYWQSYNYFEKHRSALLDEFTLKKELTKGNKHILDDIISSESISLHVRRGDYVGNSKVQNANLSIEYYKKAISFINNKIENPKFFVFSDDVSWVKENLSIDTIAVYVDINDGNHAYYDLELMKHCKHNIIANSTFSWWGAWLNDNDNKIIVSPNKWMNFDIDMNQLIPLSWNIIDAN